MACTGKNLLLLFQRGQLNLQLEWENKKLRVYLTSCIVLANCGTHILLRLLPFPQYKCWNSSLEPHRNWLIPFTPFLKCSITKLVDVRNDIAGKTYLNLQWNKRSKHWSSLTICYLTGLQIRPRKKSSGLPVFFLHIFQWLTSSLKGSFMNVLRGCVALHWRPRYTVRISNSHMLPLSVLDKVVNAFDIILIYIKPLRPRQ
jgi:hypothetical protein